MKKHPIDDIFRKKLEGVERTPSASAWERISPRKKEKRLPLMVWYMAAGVAITLMAGYMIWMNEAGNIRSELALEANNPVKVKEGYVNPLTNSDSLSEIKTDLLAMSSKKPSEREQVKQPVEEESVEIVSQPMAAIIEPAIRKESLISDVHKEPSYPEIETVEEIASTVPAMQREAESRTIVVHVSEPSIENEQEKSSRLSRIFRQLKNVKHGDSVDWTEVGFNPKEVVARVDGRLRDGEEKVSEKYQDLKERTKF